MTQIEKNILIALKSLVELNQGISGIDILLSKISNYSLAKKISNERNRNNFGNIITLIDKYLYDHFENPLVFDITDIASFDFDFLGEETIETIKTKLGVQELKLNYIQKLNGDNTNFARHWDNEKRFAVVMDENLFNSIKKNPELKIDVYKEIICAKLGYYTKFVLEKSEKKHINYNNDSYGFEDSTDWTHYNDDLDMDQQSPEFWNQF